MPSIHISRSIINSLMTFFLILVGFESAALAVRDDVLIVVNDNSTDSPIVGSYYAQKRDVPTQNIVHIRAPDNFFMTWTEFKIMRDQIIKFMQNNTFSDPNVQPVVCTGGDSPYYCQESMDQIRSNTKIRYVVTTRGVPTRMTVDNSPLFEPNAPTSVDNYLKYWLVRYFNVDVKLNFVEREQAFGNGSSMRGVNTSIDGELIVGRIDGLNLQAATDLIDRTVSLEQNGIFGQYFGSIGAVNWKKQETATNQSFVYPEFGTASTTAWRYQLGIFGESRPECLIYLDFPGNNQAGKSPTYCMVQINDELNLSGIGPIVGNLPPPGNGGSRQPRVVDALVYNGWLDGQSTASSFASMLNWRKDDQCNVTLCENAADPQACRASSSDFYKEINTDCVGTAEGFMGYQHQSYPHSYFAIWPTDYVGTGGGDYNNMAFPEVREDLGYDDSFSLWFRNTDQISNPVCYNTSDFSGAPSIPCSDERRIYFQQNASAAAISVDPVGPQTFELKFQLKTENIVKSGSLSATLELFDSGASAWVTYPVTNIATISVGSSNWTQVTANFTIDPTRHSASPISQVRYVLYTPSTIIGDVGIDAITLKDVSSQIDYAKNGSFTQGHKSNSSGDHAPNFLNRFNGVATWGSLSHHQSGGSAFAFNNLSAFVYFFRGLPLGDSVWFNEGNNSGILYGDPLYSPVSIRLNPVNASNSGMGQIELFGSTINGRDTSLVATSYSIDYCPGTPAVGDPNLGGTPEYGDFFDCDQSNSWAATGISNNTAVNDGSLGIWDASALATGPYVLRLAVTTVNSAKGKSQTYYDYYTIHVDKDSDNDGVPDINDNCTLVANGPKNYPAGDARIQRDTNHDGFGNLCDTDYDNSGYTNLTDMGTFRHYFGTTNDGSQAFADVDANGDGLINLVDLGIIKHYFGLPPGPAGELP